MDDEMIAVPRWALKFIMEHACFQDEGPTGEGWQSAEMSRATDALEAALARGVEQREAKENPDV